MSDRILLCSDLDRTLLPNGPQVESTLARPLLRALARRPEICLVYVSGRDRVLLQAAIDSYELPVPEFAIGDVGTTVYAVDDGEWQVWQHWSREIDADWGGKSGRQLHALLADLAPLRLQESSKQNQHKLSYYVPAQTSSEALLAAVGRRLARAGVRAGLVWSVDETQDQGLLDVLPASANKLHAIRFLIEHAGFDPARTVFAGDSGNDLPVLISELNAVLVANALAEVRQQAQRQASDAGHAGQLYCARGGFLGMNGCYSAGVLEGLAHFLPQTRAWLEAAAARL